MNVKDTDKGYNELVRRIDAIGRFHVLVGILEADGGKVYEDAALTVLEVAAIHEFGTDTIPERSFLRGWFDSNIDRAREALRRLMVSVVEGKSTPERALAQFGAWLKGEIQKRMAEGIPPPLADVTIERKGSSVPLIDTGQLRSSINYKVEKD